MICKVACCDDELGELKHIKKFFETLEIQTDAEFKVDYYTSGEFILEKYQVEKEPYDVLVLDMEMPDMTGLELSKKVREHDRDVLVIFLTNYPKYMHQSFSVQAFQYLMKPVSYEGFKEEMISAYQYIREDDKSIVFLSTDDGEVVIRTRDILYIEKEKGIAMMGIVAVDGKILAKGNLNDLDESVAEQPFLRISRSCLVNMEHIRRFWKQEIELSNGDKVTMSRRKVAEIKDTFTKYAVTGRRQ